MNNCELLAELLLPDIDKTPEYYENLYPERNLPEGARVTRIAPSPTGYLHLGTLFTSLVNRITATSTGVRSPVTVTGKSACAGQWFYGNRGAHGAGFRVGCGVYLSV